MFRPGLSLTTGSLKCGWRSGLHSRGRIRATWRSFAQAAGPKSRPHFWKPSRVFLLAAFTGAVTYMLGASEMLSHVDSQKHRKRIPRYATATELGKAIGELRAILGEESVSTDDADLRSHGFSDQSTVNAERFPAAIVYPKSTDEVSKIAATCSRHRVPMVPFSGGTSLEGNFAAPHGGLSIDFSFMDGIVAFHPEDMDVVVQPGLPWMTLNEHIKDSGLFFPIDPGPTAQIGGMVGTSCSGTNAVRYGTMREWVANVTVVLADGAVVKTRRRPRKSAAGYNLTSLIVGSEGTLGIVTEITLKLAVLPAQTTIQMVTFNTLRNAASAATSILQAGVPVQAIEIMDEVQMKVVNQAGATGRVWKELPTLMIKVNAKNNAETVDAIARRHGGVDIEYAQDEDACEKLWSARKNALWSMMSLRKSGHHVFSTDVAVPISRLADIIEVSKKEMDDLGLFASILGHVGDGNFHESILYDGTNAAERAAVEQSVRNMVHRAIEMEGTCTGEHGVGIGKKDHLLDELGSETVDLMRAIKSALDPLWLMNPGKIFDA